MDPLILQLVAALRAGDYWAAFKIAMRLSLDVLDTFYTPDSPPLMTASDCADYRMMSLEEMANKLEVVANTPSDVDAPRMDAAPPWLAILTPILIEVLRRFSDRFQQL